MNVVPAGTSSVANFASSASRSASPSAWNSSEVRVRFESKRARAWNASTSASLRVLLRRGLDRARWNLEQPDVVVRGHARGAASCRRRARSRRRTRRSGARRASVLAALDGRGAVREPVQRGRGRAGLDDRRARRIGARGHHADERTRAGLRQRRQQRRRRDLARIARREPRAERRDHRARIRERRAARVRQIESGWLGGGRHREREVRAAGRVGLDHLVDQLGAAHAAELREVAAARDRERDAATGARALADRRERGLGVVGVAERVEQRGDLEPGAVVGRDAGGGCASRGRDRRR